VNAITQSLFCRLEDRGFRGRAVSIRRLGDLQEEIEGWRRQGLLDEQFYQESLSWLSFRPPDSLPGARSVIVVANPQPQIRVVFTWHGETVPLLVPPTYVYREPDRQVEDVVAGILEPEGYALARSRLPVKLLAARSGLAQYGKNNVCYVAGFGSFHRLVSFYSDLPCERDNWHELEVMESCRRCSACLRHCPSGAITAERFLLRAERCLTFHNERAAELPAWVDPSWHNCLIGCFDCQRVCPENKAHLEWIEPGPEFSPQETALLLEGAPVDRLPPETVRKLERLDLVESLDVLPRNLAVLLERKP